VANDEPTYGGYVKDMRNLSTADLTKRLGQLTTAIERCEAAGWEPNTGTRLTLEAVHEVLAEREAAALETLFGSEA
jgi:ribosome-binding protein aMBF1 (putative translation factor)